MNLSENNCCDFCFKLVDEDEQRINEIADKEKEKFNKYIVDELKFILNEREQEQINFEINNISNILEKGVKEVEFLFCSIFALAANDHEIINKIPQPISCAIIRAFKCYHENRIEEYDLCYQLESALSNFLYYTNRIELNVRT